MDKVLQEQKVLIVGGNSGIGYAVAKEASRAGASVVIASRSAAAKRNIEDRFGSDTAAFCCDITVDEDITAMMYEIGSIDHLVITVRPEIKSAPFSETNIDNAREAMETKFWGQYRLIQHARKNIRSGGSVTMTSGIAGEKIYQGSSTMCVINSAIEALCRVLAVEMAPIRVNTVSPGFVEPKVQGVRDYASQFPLGRLATPEEAVQAYLFLMTNPYVTGTTIVVDGGARLI
jgi:NAD(P)-dependent dehydrogenase (short-subunit alcohol dehydrogenase family)